MVIVILAQAGIQEETRQRRHESSHFQHFGLKLTWIPACRGDDGIPRKKRYLLKRLPWLATLR